MTLVADASFVAAALIDAGSAGAWANALIVKEPLVAPHLMVAEGDVLHRGELAGDISSDVATLAHEDLLALPA